MTRGVKYEWVRTSMNALRQLNRCAAEGVPWGEYCTLFPSASGTPVVEFVHPGGHEVPKGAMAAIARFTRRTPRNKAGFRAGRPFIIGHECLYSQPQGRIWG